MGLLAYKKSWLEIISAKIKITFPINISNMI